MREVLETEAVELPEAEDGDESVPRQLPERRGAPTDVSAWRGEVRSAAIAAAGGLVAGAATVAVVRATRATGSRRPARRATRRRERPVNVVASRSFLVDVHLLGDK